MNSRYRYTVIGAGMQGTAEAFDLVQYGQASRVILCDIDPGAARRGAERVNRLTGSDLTVGIRLDAADRKTVLDTLSETDVCCAAAHYALNRDLTDLAIEAGCHFCDLGGNTSVVQQQHELHEKACAAGVAVVPDCGLAPGLGNILAARALTRMTCDTIRIRCGGLPQDPKPPLDYKLVFSISGLTNEYTGQCLEIRNGRVVELPAFTEPEDIEFPEPVGKCEAFLTSGGTSTGAFSFKGKVQNYGYKTVRYRGHYDKVRAMIDLGMLDLEPVMIHGLPVVPREVFHVLGERKLLFEGDRDVVVLRVSAEGWDDQHRNAVLIQHMMDFYDDRTGFSAMERTTAFSAAVIAVMMAQGDVQPGVNTLENAVDPDRVVRELALRGIEIHTDFRIQA
ncbi:saccharopine dehydrogenase NADP-binding domain-containing protein [bacterium]|nr:saccharopine dehydrogenase NADP-binding domain-containing protein [candidate division CSSED10-310 bacterium]